MIGVILAFAIVLLQIHYGLIPKTLTVQAVLSVAWPYAVLLFILIIIPVVRTPVILDRRRQQETEVIASEKENLSKELAEQRVRKIKLSASLKTGGGFADAFMTISSRFSAQPLTHIAVSNATLVIYNHGEKPVRLMGYKLWKLNAVEKVLECPLHEMLGPYPPINIDVTGPLVQVISGQAQPNFESVPGEYKIRFEVSFRQESDQPESQTFDFHLTCQREKGGLTLKLSANEITR